MKTNEKKIRAAINALGDELGADMVICYVVNFKSERIEYAACGSNDVYANISGHLAEAGYAGMDRLMQNVDEEIDERSAEG